MLAFFAKSSEKSFCEIVGDPWWFLDEFWWVLISFPVFFKRCKDFVVLPSATEPLVPVVQLAFVEAEMKLK